MENAYGVIYLMQLHIVWRGKNKIFTYVGQTINLKKRMKQHTKELMDKFSSKSRKIIHELWLTLDESDKDGIYKHHHWPEAEQAIIDAIINNRYNFTIISTAKDKKELNCLEMANMFIYDPKMNSFYSESNCHNIDCHICKEWMLWGKPNNTDYKPKWHWPEKSFFSGRNEIARKYLTNELLNGQRTMMNYNKWKAGKLPIKAIKLWDK